MRHLDRIKRDFVIASITIPIMLLIDLFSSDNPILTQVYNYFVK